MNVSAIVPSTWRQLQACWQALDDKKAEQLRLLYVGPQSSVTDFFLLATGTSEPHLRALANTLSATLKTEGIALVGREMETSSGWVVVDAFDFVIHIFLPEVRSRYALEQLWKDAKVVDLPAVTASLAAQAASKVAAPKATPVKKAPVKKVAAKKAAIKKVAAKTAAVKKVAVKKAATKKAATKKAPVKKVAVKKAVAVKKSAPAKKAAVKKAAVKKAPAKKAAAKKTK